MADKKFEPHMMYKGKEAENAETYQEHLKLKKMGFGHKKGPFKMKSPLHKNKGLWHNIRAKRARGEAPAKVGSKAHNDAVAAAREINKNS